VTTPLLARVAVPIPVPEALTYSVPDALAPWLRRGQRVRVPLGRRRAIGVVWGLDGAEVPGTETRPIEALLDVEPALPDDLLDLARFVSDYYLAPIGETLAAMLPQDVAPWGDRSVRLTPAGALAVTRDELDGRLLEALLETGRVRLARLLERIDSPDLIDRIRRWIEEGRVEDLGSEARGQRYTAALHLAPGELPALLERCGRSPTARGVVEFLAAAGRTASAEEVGARTGASFSVLRRMIRLGILQQFRQPERLDVGRHLLSARADRRAPISLLPEQSAALEQLNSALEERTFARFLLQGVTGSGKTEVYLRAAATALDQGRSAILLVPEIALVPALARAAIDRFGDRTAVLHSGLGNAERSQEWERVRAGQARVVVGPRSAIFAPVRDLGLVVVDEEQDSAYKQETSPRYHGRDVALVRCRQAGAAALLVSATPSLEARHAAARGSTRLLRLTRRVGRARLPEGILVDMRQEPRVGRPGEALFSERLKSELAAAVDAGDQAILLRNRRGYAPLLLCRACGEDFRCEACGLPRTLHRRERRLICHWCGDRRPVPSDCPACGAEALEPVGAGTERVEEELAALFPGVRVDVLDRDATRRIGGAAAILERFEAGESRILVGTQMLSKGHHFDRVALTAVLSADSYLGFPDFRAVERTYALLTQLAGRAGRGETAGRVVLQTFHPDHYAIRAALEHDDETFSRQEMRFRRIFDYPPFTRMALLLVRDRERERALTRIREIGERIAGHASATGLRLTGPAPAPLERLRGEWRFQLVVRGGSASAIRAALTPALEARTSSSLVIDVDPYQLL